MEEKRKIGIYPGSFDPFHIGHLACAVKAYNDYGLEKVIIMPAWQNPWKKTPPTKFHHRLWICELMTEGYDFIDVSGIEGYLKKEYTSDALEVMLQRYCDCERYIIGGTDVASCIQNWHNGKWILENYKTIEIDRPGCTTAKPISAGVKVSATELRKMIREGKLPYPYLSPTAYKYIMYNKLYTENYD